MLFGAVCSELIISTVSPICISHDRVSRHDKFIHIVPMSGRYVSFHFTDQLLVSFLGNHS